ncbi:MAG: diguanylate cyclase [Synergistaceae bacterium]|nr:diguanylate cyclase [Synergistaceae bacterium]
MDDTMPLLPEEKGAEEIEKLHFRILMLEKEAARWRREKKALRDMEGRYLALAENPLLMVLLIAERRVKYMNRRGELFFGFSLRERPSFLLEDFVAPGSGETVERLLSASEEGAFWDEREMVVLLDGNGNQAALDFAVTPAEYQGIPSLLVVAYELPLQKETKETEGISPSLDRFLRPSENLCICAIDPEGSVLSFTEGFRSTARSLWGKEPLPDSPLADFFPDGDDALPLRVALEKSLAGKEAVIGSEGENRYFRLRFSPISDGEGILLYLEDRTECRSLEAKIRSEEDLMRRVTSITEEKMLCCTLKEGRILFCSPPFAGFLGLPEGGAKGKTVADLGFFADTNGWCTLAESASAGDPFEAEMKLKTAAGEIFFGRLSGETITRKGEKCLLFLLRNVPVKKSAPETGRKTGPDSLLGIPTRSGFDVILATEVERALRYRGNLSLILLEPDGFAEMKESLGTEGADRVRKEISTLVKSRIRSIDFLGRWSDDGLAVLTPMSGRVAAQMADKIRDMISHFNFVFQRRLTASFGIAEFRKDMDGNSLARTAEKALGEAKRSGGNKALLAPMGL